MFILHKPCIASSTAYYVILGVQAVYLPPTTLDRANSYSSLNDSHTHHFLQEALSDS